MPKLEVVNANNVIEFNPQKANFKLKNTGGPKGETGAQGPKGDTGPQGLQGPAGASASVTVGSTTTLSPGADATVTNSGDTRNAILNFGIPTGARGPKGDTGSKGDTGPVGPKGAKGDTGAAATVQVGNTNTGAPGTNAQVTNAGNEHFAVFNFTIPRGDKGEKGATGAQGAKGDKGDKGDTGTAATITVGSTTTTNPGTSATVTNSGTTSAAVLNFGIPRGATGSVKSEVVSELPETGEEDTFYLVNREATEQTATGKAINFTNNDNAGDITDFKLKGETSQNGTPAPAAPVPVQTVTGENMIKICGKNLFDIGSSLSSDYFLTYANGTSISSLAVSDRITGSIANNTITIDSYTTTNWTWLSKWVELEKNTDYVLQSVHGGAGVKIVGFNSKDAATAGTQLAFMGAYVTTPATFNSGNYKYYAVSIYPVETGQEVSNTQLEKGSIATAFEPYQGQSYEVNLGNIELCKLGNAQDYIFKSGGKWYVHKEVEKVVLDGSENWYGSGAPVASGVKAYYHTIGSEAHDWKQGLCNIAAIIGQADWSTNAGKQAGNAALTGNNVYLKISETDAPTAADLKTFLASQPMIVYYPLDTPTDTEITNEALVAQLDNVASAPLYTGVNNITTITPNEQGTLEIKYVTYDKYNQNKVYIWNDTLQQWQIIVP